MAEFNFKLNQGACLSVPFLLLDDSETPIDLTGFSAAMQLRKNYYSKEAIDTLTSDNGRLVIDAKKGCITAMFHHEETQAYPAQVVVYDLEITSKDGQRTRIVEGKITIRAEVTRV